MPSGRGHKISIEEAQRRIDLVNPAIELLEYVSNRDPSPCRCRTCGHEWAEPPKNLFRGTKCPKCFKRKNNNWTTETLVAAVTKIRPDIEILGEYVTAVVPVRCKCRTCGYEWDSKPSNLLQGHGCKKCARKALERKQTKNHEQFVDELRILNPNINVLGKYQNAKTPLECECVVCNHKWSPQPTILLSGSGCPVCGRKSIRDMQLKTHEQFVCDLAAINPGIEAISQYNGSHRLITLRCKTCGEEWQCYASNIISHASGCPTCNASHGEKAVAAHLTEMGISYMPQHRFDGLVGVSGTKLSYDFFLPEHNILIEYQGQQHDGTHKLQTPEEFEKQKEHDARKRAYAERHGFHLIEIWYWDFKNVKSILNKELNLDSIVA